MHSETEKLGKLTREMDRVLSTTTRSTVRFKRIELARLMVAMSKEIERVAPIILDQIRNDTSYGPQGIEQAPSPIDLLGDMVGE